LPERFSVSVPPVANDICRSAVPAPKYLPERRSTAFPHHYTPAHTSKLAGAGLLLWAQPAGDIDRLLLSAGQSGERMRLVSRCQRT